MSFQEFSLHPQVLAGVESVGYTTPTPIQEQAIPVALQGRDLLGLAQTGTGKTAAFALPILHHLATTPPKRGIRCLVLAPTRELAEQILQAFRELGQHLGIRSIAIYGGVSKGPQLAGIRRGAQIVVACPGRLLDHMSQKDINLSQVEILVLDEADTMCDMGFLPDVRRILDQVPVERQTLFFSATMPAEIRSLAVKILKDPEMVQIGAIAPAKTVSHALYPVPDKLKRDLLLALLQQTPTGRALVFTRTKHRARRLAGDLENAKYRVAALQGNMAQNRRQQAINGFRDGKYDLLDEMPPFMFGGDMILEVTYEDAKWNELPYKFEAGTPNIADAIATGVAVDYLMDLKMDNVWEHEQQLTAYALDRLTALNGITIFGPEDPALRGGVISFVHDKIHPHDLGTALDQQGIAIRTGHHCAMPLIRSYDVVAAARASFYVYNTKTEIDALVSGISDTERYFVR